MLVWFPVVFIFSKKIVNTACLKLCNLIFKDHFKAEMIALSVSVRRGLIMGAYLAVLAALYLAPLGLDSPCIKEKGTLGPAPALIGHRGAPMVSRVCAGPPDPVY